MTPSFAHNFSSSYENGIPTDTVEQAQVESDELPGGLEVRSTARTHPSYANLLFKALEAAPEQTMSLVDVYEWFSKLGKTNGKTTKAWKNSVRHALSVNKVSTSTARSFIS